MSFKLNPTEEAGLLASVAQSHVILRCRAADGIVIAANDQADQILSPQGGATGRPIADLFREGARIEGLMREAAQGQS